MAADKMAAQTLRIITSRFSAIKKASFLTPFIGVINISTNTDAGGRLFPAAPGRDGIRLSCL
ncbi:TPA: hypothetical protein HH731_006179 [Escherichia coli]|nr:hypothetical protein [Escherichia coli]